MMRSLPLAAVFAAAVLGVIGTALLALLEVLRVLAGGGRSAGDRP
jgi:hypothetical protein